MSTAKPVEEMSDAELIKHSNGESYQASNARREIRDRALRKLALSLIPLIDKTRARVDKKRRDLGVELHMSVDEVAALVLLARIGAAYLSGPSNLLDSRIHTALSEFQR